MLGFDWVAGRCHGSTRPGEANHIRIVIDPLTPSSSSNLTRNRLGMRDDKNGDAGVPAGVRDQHPEHRALSLPAGAGRG